MALAPLGHVLFSRIMRFDPTEPDWPDRDRFVLSNGHASILQYSLLFLTRLRPGARRPSRAFRQWGSAHAGASRAPPHRRAWRSPPGRWARASATPSAWPSPSASSGPASAPRCRTTTPSCIAGDGCLQEGISHEAASLAGHLGLGRLVAVYDDNHITIDGDTTLSSSDDAAARFRAYGWHVDGAGRGRQRLRRARSGGPGGHGGRGPAVAAPAAQPHRLPLARPHRRPRSPRSGLRRGGREPHEGGHGHPRRAVLGAGRGRVRATEPIAAARGAEARQAWEKRLAEWHGDRAVWDAAWAGTGLPGWEQALPTLRGGGRASPPARPCRRC